MNSIPLTLCSFAALGSGVHPTAGAWHRSLSKPSKSQDVTVVAVKVWTIFFENNDWKC